MSVAVPVEPRIKVVTVSLRMHDVSHIDITLQKDVNMLEEFEAYVIRQTVQTIGAEVASCEISKGVQYPVAVPESVYFTPRIEINATKRMSSKAQVDDSPSSRSEVRCNNKPLSIDQSCLRTVEV
jgi:hypothetical protein